MNIELTEAERQVLEALVQNAQVKGREGANMVLGLLDKLEAKSPNGKVKAPAEAAR